MKSMFLFSIVSFAVSVFALCMSIYPRHTNDEFESAKAGLQILGYKEMIEVKGGDMVCPSGEEKTTQFKGKYPDGSSFEACVCRIENVHRFIFK